MREHGIGAAEFRAIGAVSDAEFGWFDAVPEQFRPRRLDQQCEVVSLIGDVAVADDGPMLHARTAVIVPPGTEPAGGPKSG